MQRMGKSHLSPSGTGIAALCWSWKSPSLRALLSWAPLRPSGFLTDVFSCELSPGGSCCIRLMVKDDLRLPRTLGMAGDNLKLSPSAGI